MKNLRAALAMTLLALNLSFWVIPVTLFALLRALLPIPSVQRFIRQIMEWLAVAAIAGDTLVWRFISGVQIEWRGTPPPEVSGSCIVIANHQSWADILLLQHAVVYRTPPLKWLAKRELLYVPVIGLICWAYGYPMLRRYSPEQLQNNSALRDLDAAQIHRACLALRNQPGTLMNFPEGTRHTEEKARRSQSAYEHLLSPRTGGMYNLLQIMGDDLTGILDLTIQYPQRPARLWDFLAGRHPVVRMQCEFIPRADLPFMQTGCDQRATLRDWLTQRWSRKDRLLGGFLSP